MKKRGGQEGQVLLEFILALILLLGGTLFFVQFSLGMAWGNYIHYATFMSARAYLSGGPNRADQVARATDVLTSMVKKKDSPDQDRYGVIATGEEPLDGITGASGGGVKGMAVDPPGEFDPLDRKSSWMEGVRYTFRTRMFFFGADTGPSNSGGSGVTLTSESWLGREPSVEECMQYMRDHKGLAKEVVIDNGC